VAIGLSFGRPNPLMQLLSDTVDFARLATAPIKLFITATNVRTGPRVFRNAELTAEVLLASASPWCGCRQIPDDVGVHGSVRWSHTDFTPRRPVNGVPPAVLRFYTVGSRVWGWFWLEVDASLRKLRFMACYHGVRYGMHAIFQIEAAHCTP
jgi:hypothetical protein